MHDIRIQLGEDERVLQPTQAYVVGRGQVADVRVDDPAVSRHHVDLIVDGTSWVVVDRSSAGSFVDDQQIDSYRVSGPVTVRLGPVGAPELRLEPLIEPGHSDRLPPPVADVPEERLQVGTIAVDDRALRLDLGDMHRAFAPGDRVVVGRDAACDLVADDRLVSSQHCSFDWDGEHWILTDLGSTRGTYVDGRKISKPTPVEGALHVMLGGASAGSQLRVVTAGEHTPPRNRGGLVPATVALVAVVALVIAGIVFWPSGDSAANSDEQLAAAKSATVFVLYLNPDGSGGNGSGAFISDDLVLTNRHVAEAGEELLLGVSDAEDEPVAIRYRGELEASHPYLDLALIRVTGVVELGEDEVIDLPDTPPPPPGRVPVGDSSDLRSGDGLHALGFPAITTLFGDVGGELVTPGVSVSEGEIVTFQPWPSCDNPEAEVLLVPGGQSRCSTDGQLARGNMVTSDLSGSGGSGGPVVVDGRLVAVRYAGIEALSVDTGAVSTAGAAISIPIEFARPWIEGYLAG